MAENSGRDRDYGGSKKQMQYDDDGKIAQEIAPEDIQKLAKVHKNFRTTFNICCPPISSQEVNENTTFVIQDQTPCVWTQFLRKDKQSLYLDMVRNFEIEKGDFLCRKDERIKHCFFLCTNLLKENLKPSDRWAVTGFMVVEEEYNIPYLWIHPYLRGRGIFGKFIYEYAQNFGPLNFEVPFSKELQNVLLKVQKKFENEPEAFKKHINRVRIWLSNRTGYNLANVTDEEMIRVTQALCGVIAARGSLTKADEIKFVIEMVKLIRYVKQNPDKYLDIFPELKGQDHESIIKESRKLMQKYMDTGKPLFMPPSDKDIRPL